MKRKIESLIKKHYGKGSRYSTRGWEQCGVEFYNMLDKEAIKRGYHNLRYSEQCRKIDEMIDKWEKEYHSYFKVDGYFNWINGNNKLKELLQK